MSLILNLPIIVLILTPKTRFFKNQKSPVSKRKQAIFLVKFMIRRASPAKGAFYEDANASSTTLCLRYGDFSALLTGDLEGEGEKDLLGYLKRSLAAVPDPGTRDDPRDGSCLLRTSLLKVAHHGSRNATSDEFLASFHADFAVISAGVNNMYGHPNPELLQRLTDAGISCDRTDQSGMITVGIKGGRFFIRDFLQNSQRQKSE